MSARSTSTEAAPTPARPGGATARSLPGAGGVAAAVGAVVLFGSLFLDWYRYPSRTAAGDAVDVSAWEVLSATDALLAGLAAIVVLAVVLGTSAATVPAVRYASGLILGIAGITALALVVARLAFPPGSPTVLGVLGVTIDATRLGGVIVALGAAIVMAAGGVVAASGAVLEGVSRALERLNRGL